MSEPPGIGRPNNAVNLQLEKARFMSPQEMNMRFNEGIYAFMEPERMRLIKRIRPSEKKIGNFEQDDGVKGEISVGETMKVNEEINKYAKHVAGHYYERQPAQDEHENHTFDIISNQPIIDGKELMRQTNSSFINDLPVFPSPPSIGNNNNNNSSSNNNNNNSGNNENRKNRKNKG